MRCPDCGSAATMVLETRRLADGKLRRRRGCKDCGSRFSTVETPVSFRKGRQKAPSTPAATPVATPPLDEH